MTEGTTGLARGAGRPSTRRATTGLAWSVCGLSLALLASALALAVLNGADVYAVSFPLTLTASVVVGGLVASRRPENPIGWFFLGGALCFAFVAFAGGYATYRLLTAPGAQPFPGQRWYPLMGVYAGANQGWVSEPGLIDKQYAGYVGSHENAYLDLGDGDDERYYFCGGRKITWTDALVDPTLVPTSRAQAQDPNWSNYKWNNNDIITQMLDSSSAIAAGKAKMCIFVATTATSVKNPVPAFMMNDPRDLTWTDGQGKDHVRLDKQAGYEAMADFLIALTKKYGNDPRIASITHGEYYTNPDGGGLPADLDYNAFRTNIKQVWSQVIAASPRDANGDRVPFIQSQPIVAGGFVTATDIANIGVGVSGSEAQIFSSAGGIENVRKQLYGVVPLTHQVNTGQLGSNATWDGTPNPWGYTNGQSVPIRYEHVAWYFDSQGKVPLDSLMMRDDATYQAQWHEAYTQFGPNGTQVVQWGQIPNYPPN